jgi:hypothetical protein
VTQRVIEAVIGRLITDEAFRAAFLMDPHKTLAELVERGLHLTHGEVAALVDTDSALWEQVAERIDSRLQKANLNS